MKKIALVGLGFMGGMHAQIYQQLRDATLVGVVDPTAEKARQKLEGFGIRVPVYETLSQLLGEHEADVVDVCVPTDLHASTCLEAIGAGKNVFCEKPLALDIEAAEEVVRAVESRGLSLMVGHCIRFWPEYQALEAFCKSGRAGRLLSLTMQRRSARPLYSEGNWLQDSRRSRGGAFDLHIHDTDYVHHLLGMPTAVTSTGRRDASGWSHIFTRYHFDNTVVMAEGGWDYPQKWGFQMAFQAVFENGTVEYDSGAQPTLKYTLGEAAPAPLPYQNPSPAGSRSGEGNISALGGYYNELKYFIDCLNRNEQPMVATGQQAVQSIKTVLAEMESAETDRTVSLA